MTVIDAATLCDRFAVTLAPESLFGAKARQISAVPSWVFVRRTKTQVKLAPLMLVTVIPADLASVAAKASKSSLGDFVENEGEEMLEAEPERLVETVTSVAIAPQADDAADKKMKNARIHPLQRQK
jgi:hypothetical protein